MDGQLRPQVGEANVVCFSWTAVPLFTDFGSTSTFLHQDVGVEPAVDPTVLVGHRNGELAYHTQAAAIEFARPHDLVD